MPCSSSLFTIFSQRDDSENSEYVIQRKSLTPSTLGTLVLLRPDKHPAYSLSQGRHTIYAYIVEPDLKAEVPLLISQAAISE